MRRHRYVVLVVLALAAAPAPPPVAAADRSSAHSDNLSHVANLRFEERRDLGSSQRLATDTDFLTYHVPADFAPPDDLPPELVPTPGETREFALVGSQVNGMRVVDITDPHNPAVVADYECAVAQGDVFLFEREDLGRTFAAYSSDVISSQTNFNSRCHNDNAEFRARGRYGTFLIDVTDPYRPTSVSFIPVARGSHQVTVHPSGQWLYSSSSSRSPATGAQARAGQLDLVDISDPYAPGEPTFLPWLTGFDAHDLSFSEDGTRAYVAALSHTVILDTSDPADPVIIGEVIDPAVDTHHDAYTFTSSAPGVGERSYLFIVDELLGAGGNGYCPGGGVHVYDITGSLEARPVKVGSFYAPDVLVQEGGRTGTGGLVRCTAHVPQIHQEQQLVTIAWFGAGVRVLDISGVVGLSAGATPDTSTGRFGSGIREVGFYRFADSDVWAAKTNHIEDDGSFYLYSIDTVRNFDVFRFDATAAGSADPGRWLTPEQALAEARSRRSRLSVTATPDPYRPICTL